MEENNSYDQQPLKRHRLTKADQSKGGKKGGKVAGKKVAETYGPEYMKEIQSRGGKNNVARHGKDHMSEIGKKGAQTLHKRYDTETKAAMVLDGRAKAAKQRETVAQHFDQLRDDEIQYADEFSS